MAFIEPGFIEPGFFEEPSPASSVNSHWTDFREYRRGRRPGDWTLRWDVTSPTSSFISEGAFFDLPHKNVLRGSASANRAAISWNAPERDNGVNDQEILVLHRLISGSHLYAMLRGSGNSVATASGYIFSHGADDNTLSINRLTNNVSTTLASLGGKSYRRGTWIFMRCRIQGTTLRTRIWPFGDVEPGTWDLTVTDSTYGNGWLGVFNLNSTSEVEYLGVATNGETAPSYENRDEPFETWIKREDEQIDIAIRMEYYDPATDSVNEAWISRMRGSRTAFHDFPSETIIHPLLLDAGVLSSRLEADIQLGNVELPSFPQGMRFDNKPYKPNIPGPLSSWINYSFHGRPIEVRAGKVYKVKPKGTIPGVMNSFRRYELLGCALMAQEPSVEVEQVSISLTPSDTKLKARVPVRRNIGIPTAVRSLSTAGYVTIPSNAAYDIASFAIYLRLFVPLSGIAGTGFSQVSVREDATPKRQWQIALFYNAHASFPNQLWISSYKPDGTFLFSNTIPFSSYFGTFTDIIAAIDQRSRWYLLIKGAKVLEGILSDAPVINSGFGVSLLKSGTGLTILDHRIEKFVDEDEALARFSTRRDPDATTISMHRCDDNVGDTVTDYAPLANHGMLQGTNNIDRSWAPSYLGSVELSGTSMPFSGGVLFHAPAQPVDSLREIFRYNDGAKTPGTDLQIRAKGLLLSGGGVSYSEPSDGQGTADIVGASDQPITYGMVPSVGTENPRIHISRLVKDELIVRESLDISSCDTESFEALRRLLPMKGGFHYQEPPSVEQYLKDQIGPLGCYYSFDRDGRLYVDCLLPTINPGQYGIEPLLEFLGRSGCGVTFSDHPSFRLNQTGLDFGLMCLFKLTRKFIPDKTISTSGDYSQPGYTLIDKMDGGTTGYYLGLDGDTGALRFAAGGVDFGGGKHYITLGSSAHWPVGVWCAVSVLPGIVEVQTFIDGVADIIASRFEPFSVSGSLADSTGIPLRIGHGPQGPFIGSISYVFGCSPAQDPPSFNALANSTGPEPHTGTDRFRIFLNDGTEHVLDTVTGRKGKLSGVRWCPKLTFDMRKVAMPAIGGIRRPIPAWRVESRHSANLQVLTGADVVASVSASTRIALGQPYLSKPASDEGVKEKFKDSRDASVSSSLYAQDDAEFISRMIRSRIGSERRFVPVRKWFRESLSLESTDEVVVYHDSFDDIRGGRALRMAGSSVRHLNDLRGDVEFWG